MRIEEIEKMRVGILTFHRSYNNGAILQAYALSKAIEKQGAEANVIDFRNDDIEKPTRIILEGEKITPKNIVRMGFRIYRHFKVDSFIKKNLRLSIPVRTQDELEALEPNYERFITGSDQVWNDSHNKENECFYLDFVKDSKKKYAYAASISGDEAKAKKTISLHNDLINQYQSVSLRESNIEKLFREKYGDRVRVDLDPVLLLDRGEWQKIASKRLHRKKYIFMYLVPKSAHIEKFAHAMAKHYGYDLISNKSSKEYLLNCGIEDFLSWIDNAEFVITNSFHGTAFSLLFNKLFFVEMESEIGYNYRVKELLDRIGIDNIDDINIDGDGVQDISSIDFNQVNKNLLHARNQSVAYLNAICEI